MRSGAAMTLAAILIVSMMINLANYPGEIVDESPLSNTGESSNFYTDWSYTAGGALQAWNVAISANGEYIVAGGDNNIVYLFNKNSNQPLWMNNIGVDITRVDISADGEYIVVATDSFVIYFFDKDSSTPLWTFDAYRESEIAISANGEYIVVGTADGHNSRVHLFSTSSNSPIWSYTAGGDIRTVAISDDGEYITAGGNTNMVYLFSKNSGTPLWDYNTGDDVLSVSISADGEYIVAGTENHGVHLFSKDGSTPLWDYYTNARVITIAISADGEYIVAGNENDLVFLFDKDSGNPLWSYQATVWIQQDLEISDVAISANGDYIVAGDTDGNVILFDKNSSTPQSITNLDPDSPVWVSISEDGRHIVAGGIASGVYKFTNYLDGQIPVEISVVQPPAVVVGDTLMLSGTVKDNLPEGWLANHWLEIFIDGILVGITSSDENGDWAYNWVISDFLDVGFHTITIYAPEQGYHRMGSTETVLLIAGCNPDNAATATVTITDLTEINNGDKVTLVAADWTSHDFTAGDIAGGGIWIAETNNNASAINLAAQINANAKFSATAVSAVVTITQVTAGAGGNTTVTLTDSGAAGMSKTDFTGGCDLTEWIDTDGDGVGDNADLNDDGDAWTDAEEFECGSDALDADSVPDDYDGDMICDKVDTDDDGDGTPDTLDAFPFDATENADNDGDGVGDFSDTDDDNDGWMDNEEPNCGTDPMDHTSVPADNDMDHDCDITDQDDDNDGVLDLDDAFPMNPNENRDLDGDGTGDNADIDDDGDGWLDTTEVICRNALNGQGDPNNANVMPVDNETDVGPDGVYGTDDDMVVGDGLCNAIDPDDDNDGVPDPVTYTLDANGVCTSCEDWEDHFPWDPTEQYDGNNDGQGDNGNPLGILDDISAEPMPFIAIAVVLIAVIALIARTAGGKDDDSDEFDMYDETEQFLDEEDEEDEESEDVEEEIDA